MARSKGVKGSWRLNCWCKVVWTLSLVKTDFAGKGPFYVFADANIEVVQAQEETPQDALRSLGLEMPAGLDPKGMTEWPVENAVLKERTNHAEF